MDSGESVGPQDITDKQGRTWSSRGPAGDHYIVDHNEHGWQRDGNRGDQTTRNQRQGYWRTELVKEDYSQRRYWEEPAHTVDEDGGAKPPWPSVRPSPSWSWIGTATCAGIGSSDGVRPVTWPLAPTGPNARGPDRRGTATAPSRAQAGTCIAATAPPWSTANSGECAPTAPTRTTSRSSSTIMMGTEATSGPSTGQRTNGSLGTGASQSSR
eukprot:9332581-Heterocapsa_arctica.AAC.1